MTDCMAVLAPVWQTGEHDVNALLADPCQSGKLKSTTSMRCWLTLASMAAAVLMLCLPAAAAQMPSSEGEVIAGGAVVERSTLAL